ncbi:MAG TPA: PAS domain S-box protein [Gaiellaceae bacterium]
MSRNVFVLAAAVALVEAAAAVAIVTTSDHEPHKVATIALALTAGVSFVVSGLIALRRRPENRVGLYLAAVGYLWFLGALGDANNNTVWTVGMFLSNLAFIPFAALVLAFPSGRLAPRPDRLLVAATAAFVLIGPPLLLLFADKPPSCGDSCGSSVIVVHRSPTTEHVIDIAGSVVTAVLIALIVAVLFRRWRAASVALRRIMLPVYLAGAGALVLLLVANVLSSFSTRTADALGPVFLVFFGAVPIAFLLGVLRSRLARSSVAGLALAVGQGRQLREAIAEAVGDPTLELAYCVDDGDRFVDREGRRFDLPADGSGRAATMVELEGRRIGALVHDDSLREEEPELVESVAATAALALDNERLQAELRTQYDFLTTIVDTAPSLLTSIDGDGRIRNLNPATVEASGYDSEAQVRGRFFWDVFIDRSEREAVIGRFHAAAPDHPPAEYENVFTNARGERRVIAWRSAPVLDDTGKVIRIVAGGLDITERKRQEEELRASRTRLVAAGDDARRRLERNLHDGAQQRLVSLSVALRLAQSKLASDPVAAGELMEHASVELSVALEELRELARGIHPAVLTDRGLDAALRSLADRTPIPVDMRTAGRMLPAPIAAAAYYVVSEAIANVVKHAHASSIEVDVSAPNGRVLVEVADDGVGGADATAGSGLRGLADRVAVLDGRLRVESPPAGGTRVVAEIPLES